MYRVYKYMYMQGLKKVVIYGMVLKFMELFKVAWPVQLVKFNAFKNFFFLCEINFQDLLYTNIRLSTHVFFH